MLYVPTGPLGAAQGRIVEQNLSRIGISVEVKQLPVPGLVRAGPARFNIETCGASRSSQSSSGP